MTSTNKYSYLRLFNFAILGIVLFTTTSCELEDSVGDIFQFAELEVYVSGTLSGNPRSDLKVAVYNTEEDAINEVNAITFPQNTDSDGYAFFQGLEPGFRYWVRVDTTLLNNINHTEQLNEGFNEMSMTIL
jgi:hypothetical protein